MQHSTKQKVLLAFVVASLIFYVFMFLATTKTIVNVSAVDTSHGVGVYWDQACTRPRTEIDWGTLNPGSVKNELVYIKNIEGKPFLNKSTEDWYPVNADKSITLLWDYSGRRMNSGDVLQITLTLSVSRDIEGISNFSFDILIAGSDTLPVDVNGDGVVNVLDVTDCCINMGPVTPANSQFDINDDGSVNILDVTLCCINMG